MSPTDDSAGGQGPGPGGGFPSSPTPPADPRTERAAYAVALIVQSSRQISMMFPNTSSEMRDINNIMSRVQAKLQGSAPGPETAAPPS